MSYGEPARVPDRLDLPRHPRRAFALGLVAPQDVHRLHKSTWRVHDEVFALRKGSLRSGMFELIARSGCPVGLDARSEVVLGPDRGVGDRLPETLRGRADV